MVGDQLLLRFSFNIWLGYFGRLTIYLCWTHEDRVLKAGCATVGLHVPANADYYHIEILLLPACRLPKSMKCNKISSVPPGSYPTTVDKFTLLYLRWRKTPQRKRRKDA